MCHCCKSSVRVALFHLIVAVMQKNYSGRNAYYATCDIINFREEPIDYGDLDTALRKTCAKMNLKDVEGKLILLWNIL